jgi:diacylglycerol kinase (ATP)
MPFSISVLKSPSSDMPRNLLFIVNPNAGKKTSASIIKTIEKGCQEKVNYHVVLWENKDHFVDISTLLNSGDYTDAIAVGGDGTVNKVASLLVGSNIRLGIIPIGSGNGLARSLGLSMKVDTAIKQILVGESRIIDTGCINGEPFFCTSGLGFDAHIAWLFGQSKFRGFRNYAKITVSQLLKYKAKEYMLEMNGEVFRRKAFLITVANAGQYGNDVYIAPNARLDDGLFHVVIVKPFNILHLPVIFIRVLMKKEQSKNIAETYTTTHLKISRTEADSIHFDGEPHMAGLELNYTIVKNSLHVIVGPSYRS